MYDVDHDLAMACHLSTEAKPAPAKRKLPSASAMMAATTSWARPDNDPPPARIDDVGTKYHNVAPPAGVRAEDGVMGGGGDYIKPVFGGGVSLDANTVCLSSCKRVFECTDPSSDVECFVRGLVRTRARLQNCMQNCMIANAFRQKEASELTCSYPR